MGRVLTATRLANAAASRTETNPRKEEADKRPQHTELCGQEESKRSVPQGGQVTRGGYTSAREKRISQDFIWCRGEEGPVCMA